MAKFLVIICSLLTTEEMKLLGILALQVHGAANFRSAETGEFEQWMKKYEKSYLNHDTYLTRSDNYYTNVETINQINSENRGWNAGVNKFSDLTWEEFQYFYLMKAGLSKQLI